MSAESICNEEGLESNFLKSGASDEDWIWIAVAVLWERWFPEQPSMEMLNSSMMNGYDEEGEKSVEIWLETWEILKSLVKRVRPGNFEDFDKEFRGAQFVFNWVTDFSHALYNLSLDDPRYTERHREYLEWLLESFPNDTSHRHWIRGDLGECIGRLQGRKAMDDFFHEWVEEDPADGNAWYYWSACYFFDFGYRDFARSEEIIREGLMNPDVSGKEMIVDRLFSIYEETGRDNAPLHKEFAEFLPALATKPMSRHIPEKTGRNEPCPCGSGKKFKKCCGRSD